MIEQWQKQMKDFRLPDRRPLLNLGKQKTAELPLLEWTRSKGNSCYICNRIEDSLSRYYSTFFVLIKDPEFREKVESCKGFCVHHFAQLLEFAQKELPNSQLEWFYTTVLKLMGDNLVRVKEDIDWFVEKHDYRQAGAPWKNSMDAVPRGMQKLKGGHPSDKPYQTDF